MNLDTKVALIRDEIFKEVAAKVDLIEQQTLTQIAAKEAEAKHQLDVTMAKYLAEEQAKVMLNHKRNLSKAMLEHKSLKLHAAAAIIDKAQDEIMTQLSELRANPQYPEMVKALIIEATQMLNDNQLTILFDKRDAHFINMDFLGSIEIIFTFKHNRPVRYLVTEEYIITVGGIILKVNGKSLSINNTFEERLNEQTNYIKKLIFEQVLKEGAGW